MEEIMVVMGTRPEAIKLCPLIMELKKRGRYAVKVISSGQHRKLLEDALSAFSVKPDLDLDVMRQGQSLSCMSGRILQGVDALLESEKPSAVVVQGDTATAFCGALSAFYRRIPVYHVEAGLRTHHMDSPFPEEFHRVSISHMAALHFAPTVTAKKNLVAEGVKDSSIVITGNTVVDALRHTLTSCRPSKPWRFPRGSRILLFTAHRRESLGEPIREMLRALKRLVVAHPDVIAVCPLHPNAEVRSVAGEILAGCERIHMIEPPATVSFHHLLAHADLVLTDSGGIQEEAVALGIPTLVMRYTTERTEGLRAGVLRLCGSGEEGIFDLAHRLLVPDSEEYEMMKKPSRIFGDGHAASRIADAMERAL